MSRASTAELYETANQELAKSGELYKSLVNGIREHLDRFAFISSAVQSLKPETVLDVGCSFGTVGALVRLNHGTVKHVTGLDWSATALDFARDYMGYDEVVMADAEDWNPPLQDSADLVLCLEILEHVRDPRILVGNVFAWTKKYAIFSVPVEAGEPDGEFHVRKVSMEQLVDWVEKGNFRVLKSEFLPSRFCEGHWLGWNFVLATATGAKYPVGGLE